MPNGRGLAIYFFVNEIDPNVNVYTDRRPLEDHV